MLKLLFCSDWTDEGAFLCAHLWDFKKTKKKNKAMQHLIAAHVRQDTAVCKFSRFLMCILYINLNVVWVFSLGYLLH